MNKIVNGVANDFEFETLTRWQDPTIDMLKKEVEEYKEKIDKVLEYIENTSWNSNLHEVERILKGSDNNE